MNLVFSVRLASGTTRLRLDKPTKTAISHWEWPIRIGWASNRIDSTGFEHGKSPTKQFLWYTEPWRPTIRFWTLTRHRRTLLQPTTSRCFSEQDPRKWSTTTTTTSWTRTPFWFRNPWPTWQMMAVFCTRFDRLRFRWVSNNIGVVLDYVLIACCTSSN